jgi:hypothetical protein
MAMDDCRRAEPPRRSTLLARVITLQFPVVDARTAQDTCRVGRWASSNIDRLVRMIDSDKYQNYEARRGSTPHDAPV